MELPDVNVLIALFDPAHVHHESAQNWFFTARQQGWATCPLTENGFLRVVTNPNYPNINLTVGEAGRHLHTLIANHPNSHQFWADDISLRDVTLFHLNAIQGYRQLTDLYLLGLCQRRASSLITFDSGIQATVRAIASPHSGLVRMLTT